MYIIIYLFILQSLFNLNFSSSVSVQQVQVLTCLTCTFIIFISYNVLMLSTPLNRVYTFDF